MKIMDKRITAYGRFICGNNDKSYVLDIEKFESGGLRCVVTTGDVVLLDKRVTKGDSRKELIKYVKQSIGNILDLVVFSKYDRIKQSTEKK